MHPASVCGLTKRFPQQLLAAFERTNYVRIRVGEHRFIPVWTVVVESRVLVRSWHDKPSGWCRAFLAQPLGAVQLEDRELVVRAVPLRSTRLNDAADHAYAAKYRAKPNAKCVQALALPERKATTLELVPAY